eukprot:359194-Chlamydomonas_euryale.AAC.8
MTSSCSACGVAQRTMWLALCARARARGGRARHGQGKRWQRQGVAGARHGQGKGWPGQELAKARDGQGKGWPCGASHGRQPPLPTLSAGYHDSCCICCHRPHRHAGRCPHVRPHLSSEGRMLELRRAHAWEGWLWVKG